MFKSAFFSILCLLLTNLVYANEITADFYGSEVIDDQLGINLAINSTVDKKFSPLSNDKQLKVVVFGYTHCPDVCPTNLIIYNDALKMLGEKAKDVQLFFITLDPERDNKTVLQGYLPIFNKSYIGLIADNQQQLEQIKKAWKVTSRRVDRKKGAYLIDHSTGTFMVNRQGQVVLYQPHSQTAKQLAHDIKLLLN